jgi:hypothetical protein
MDVSLEALIVGLFAVLPGFVSAAVRAVIAPADRSSTGEWVAGSVVASLSLNALVLIGFLPAAGFNLGQPVAGVAKTLGQVPVRLVVEYLVALYVLALGWGVVSGFLAEYAPRALAHRLRLTPVSPTPNVFNDTIEKLVSTAENRKRRDDPARPVPWLRVQREKTAVVGRLRRGSVDFEVDKPVEVFLSPAYRSGPEGPLPWPPLAGAEQHGIYLRLLPNDIAEVFTARADWTPQLAQIGPPPMEPEAEAMDLGEGGGSRDW